MRNINVINIEGSSLIFNTYNVNVPEKFLMENICIEVSERKN